MTQNIFILSGPIHSGKTTKLYSWLKNRKDVYGIISPLINDKRTFVNIATSAAFAMEEIIPGEKTIAIGKYIFSEEGFKKANAVLVEAGKLNTGWLIIDEIGPLELRGEGFASALEEIIKNLSKNLQLVLVIRETLVEQVVERYRIGNRVRKFDFPEL